MLELLVSTLIQGLIYALVSFGVYITYSILDFPDLGVDGSFPLGAAVTAVLLTRGCDPYLTLLAAVAVGALDAAENVGAPCVPASAEFWPPCWVSPAGVLSSAVASPSSGATSEYDTSLATVS